ncbi:hypothetical protein GCM10010495_69590 [Kitasatospora herbaricolor]|uniref:DUF6416 domain-containing protein n=1 Tax=Kitasatospora herbaricolor TaxID=68217 RepID=UPI0019B2B997|nr:DUF6416 domain-containing protein [Kitasatospora herbaricolor]MDQ0313326.1 hypothetical protein [Kitasatospora herbaricolor]GGV42022.1 hypothetical protein GCM10010495_69590 [Kitasatospora herbaricolor]
MPPLIEVRVLVDEDRVPEFYEMVGRWLGSPPLPDEETGTLAPWAPGLQDLQFARTVWEKLSDRAQALFETLIASPGRRFSAEELAEQLHLPNGKYGVAGVLAWPGRHCRKVGRPLPVEFAPTPVGEGADYWMTAEAAALFTAAATP